MTRVLAAADATTDESLTAAETEIEHLRKRVRVAIQRQARFVYLQGWLYGTVVAVVLCVQLTLDFNAFRGRLLALGGLRPLVGAVFGAVAQFALGAGLFGADLAPTAVGVFALIGFAAGFSERFATDMVERAGHGLAGRPDQSV